MYFFSYLCGKISGQFVYWANKPIPQNPTKNVVNVPFMWPRIIYPNEAYAVQSTSYALMVYLNNNYLSDSVPIMKWLQTMRNSIGGFGGTRVSFRNALYFECDLKTQRFRFSGCHTTVYYFVRSVVSFQVVYCLLMVIFQYILFTH